NGQLDSVDVRKARPFISDVGFTLRLHGEYVREVHACMIKKHTMDLMALRHCGARKAQRRVRRLAAGTVTVDDDCDVHDGRQFRMPAHDSQLLHLSRRGAFSESPNGDRVVGALLPWTTS